MLARCVNHAANEVAFRLALCVQWFSLFFSDFISQYTWNDIMMHDASLFPSAIVSKEESSKSILLNPFCCSLWWFWWQVTVNLCTCVLMYVCIYCMDCNCYSLLYLIITMLTAVCKTNCPTGPLKLYSMYLLPTYVWMVKVPLWTCLKLYENIFLGIIICVFVFLVKNS